MGKLMSHFLKATKGMQKKSFSETAKSIPKKNKRYF